MSCPQALEMGAIPKCATSLCSILWLALSWPDSCIEDYPLCRAAILCGLGMSHNLHWGPQGIDKQGELVPRLSTPPPISLSVQV